MGEFYKDRDSFPLFLDTDIFGDFDDAAALVMASRSPNLAAVFTVDERPDGLRARGARHLLDLCRRPDVPVMAGAQLSREPYWSAEGLVPSHIGPQTGSMIDFVDRVCASGRPARWVGMGPMTNLARVLAGRPELAKWLRVTQMGGAIKPRHDGVDKGEHNVRYDVPAARYVLDRMPDLRLVTLDVTWHDAMAIDTGHELYRRLQTSSVPWAKLLIAHMNQWFDRYHPATRLHDPLTLSSALGQPFVGFEPTRFGLEPDGRMFTDPAGHTAMVSFDADYPAFMDWALEGLTTNADAARLAIV